MIFSWLNLREETKSSDGKSAPLNVKYNITIPELFFGVSSSNLLILAFFVVTSSSPLTKKLYALSFIINFYIVP